MSKLYFTRHGQTIWNVENKICGATDIALTQLGHQQAAELGEMILRQGISIDEILCSPLMRARDTAAHISQVTGIPLRVEPRLTEQNFGRFEGTPRDGAEFLQAKSQFVNHFETGESMLRLCQRIYNLLDEVTQETRDTGKTYLLVAHNGIARAVHSYFCDMSNEEYAASGMNNCQLREYEF